MNEGYRFLALCFGIWILFMILFYTIRPIGDLLANFVMLIAMIVSCMISAGLCWTKE